MWDDERLREALRDEVNGPAPAMTTELSDIMPRGRRRRRMRQAGSVAAAVAVVAGVGVVAMTLSGPGAKLNEPAQPSELPTVQGQEAPWQRADLQAETPVTTFTPHPDSPPLPGVPKTGFPRCAAAKLPGDPVPTPAAMSGQMRERFLRSLRAAAGPAKLGELRTVANAANRPEYSVDITDGGGTGSVRVWPERSPAEPLITADAEAFSENSCQPPRRLVRPDGTIVQIYQIRPTFDGGRLESVTQTMSVYLPDRSTYRITVQNSPGQNSPGQNSPGQSRTGRDRASLPLTEYQLSRLGEGVIG